MNNNITTSRKVNRDNHRIPGQQYHQQISININKWSPTISTMDNGQCQWMKGGQTISIPSGHRVNNNHQQCQCQWSTRVVTEYRHWIREYRLQLTTIIMINNNQWEYRPSNYKSNGSITMIPSTSLYHWITISSTIPTIEWIPTIPGQQYRNINEYWSLTNNGPIEWQQSTNVDIVIGMNNNIRITTSSPTTSEYRRSNGNKSNEWMSPTNE